MKEKRLYPIDDNYLKKILREAKYLASSRRNYELADDFAGYAVLRAIEANERINLKWVYADFMKKTYGILGTKKNKALRNERKDPIEIVEDLDINENGIIIQAKENPTNYIADRATELELSQHHRVVFVLYYLHDFPLKEIAEVMGISENLVWQYLDEVHYKIKRLCHS